MGSCLWRKENRNLYSSTGRWKDGKTLVSENVEIARFEDGKRWRQEDEKMESWKNGKWEVVELFIAQQREDPGPERETLVLGAQSGYSSREKMGIPTVADQPMVASMVIIVIPA